ncbi:MAG: arginine--tRNA ligase, partial [Rikenellaceae bacterium]
MNSIEGLVAQMCRCAVESLYGEVKGSLVQIQATRKDFEGDYTLVTFPLLKSSRKSPEATAQEVGEYLAANNKEVAAFNVIKGFLNISLSERFWSGCFEQILRSDDFGRGEATGKRVMVEYSSPNTNKPLHLGHIRNNLLGWSVAEILKMRGDEVLKVNLVNDRGIHICKSMLAWQLFVGGETPESSGMK